MSGIDNRLDHLYPAFRVLVEAVLKQANHETAGKYPEFARWKVFEGFRSRERQAKLYEQGRSTPGPIVTNMRTPKFHGFGLAADIVWIDINGKAHWDGSEELWQHLGHAVNSQKDSAGSHTLQWGGSWTGALVDKPHVQPSDQLSIAWGVEAAYWRQREGLA